MEILIRNLAEKDLQGLKELYRGFWGEESDIGKMEAIFGRLERNEDYLLLVAEVDGVLAGSVQGVVCYELYGACRPFLVMENLIVDDDFQHRGIARQLIRRLEELAEQRGCYQMLFITEEDRSGAVRFYEKRGFNSRSHVGFKRAIGLKQ